MKAFKCDIECPDVSFQAVIIEEENNFDKRIKEQFGKHSECTFKEEVPFSQISLRGLTAKDIINLLKFKEG